jgi:mannose-6-phosphate isomerase-like protein (cupin superfamily)
MYTMIKKKDARIVDLGTKVIEKYTAPDRSVEINHMTIHGRHPETPGQFIYETGIHWMLFVIRGTGNVYLDDETYTVSEGDAIDILPNTRFAAEGHDFEYITVENPAWYPEQASIVDAQSNRIQSTNK